MAMTYIASFTGILFVVSLCGWSYADNEDELIERFTKLEHVAKEVKQEMIRLRINVGEKLQTLKSKEFDWLRDYFGHKKRIPNMEYFLKRKKNKVKDLIQKLEKKRRVIRLKFHKYRVVHGDRDNTEKTCHGGFFKSIDVSFRTNDALKTNVKSEENFIFTNTPENNGNAYDNYTGVFIAPVTGTYFFVLQLCHGGNHIDLSIRKEGEIFSWARFWPYYLLCQTVNMLIPLEIGDQVNPVKIYSWDYYLMSDDNKLYNTFIGVLLA